MLEIIRFILCALFMLAGLMVEVTALVGVNRFSFSLTRIHAAGMGDTLGLFCIAVALIIASSSPAVSVKLMLMVVLLWVTSPVSGHLLGELVYLTDDTLKREAREWKS